MEDERGCQDLAYAIIGQGGVEMEEEKETLGL